jgi:beta-fructofuranosidase
MWESDMPTKEDGWCGALTLPRELTLGANNKILMNPVEELTLLRESEHKVCTNQSISGSYLVETKNDLIELKVEFDLSKTTAQSVGLKIRGLNLEETTVMYQIENQKLLLDCSKSGKEEDGVRCKMLESNQLLSLRVFIDRSSIEVFANDGQASMTSRLYPQEERLGIELFAQNGDVQISEFTYWNLKEIWK